MTERHDKSLDPDYFESMFRGTDDPWDLGSSDYEAAKYDATIAALGERRIQSALDVGCAKGMLTERLAPLCDTLLATDVSKTALDAARSRLAGQTNVSFAQMQIPVDLPQGQFDLILLSEVVYYWDDADIARAGRWLDHVWAIGGRIELVHWTGATDYPQSGDEAVAKLAAAMQANYEVLLENRTDNYRLDLWQRV